MKKLYALIGLVLLVCAAQAQAANVGLLRMMTVNTSACSSPDSNATSSSDASIGKDDAGDAIYSSGSFTSTSAYTLKSFTVDLLRTTVDPSLTITGKICTDNSGDPSTTCTTADATVASSVLTTSAAAIRFAIAAGYSISNATKYHIVISVNPLGTATAYVKRKYLNTGSEAQRYSPDGTTWTGLDTASTTVFSTSTCEAQ
jgi:hypothetical protein